MKSQTILICAVALLAVPILAFANAAEKDAQSTDGPMKVFSGVAVMPSNANTNGSARASGTNSCGGRGCYYYPNETIPGTGYKLFKTSSQDKCCNACFKDSRCYVWSWGFRGNRKKQCYFFSQSDYNNKDATYTQYYNSGFGLCNGQ